MGGLRPTLPWRDDEGAYVSGILEHTRRVGDLRAGLDMERAVDVLWF